MKRGEIAFESQNRLNSHLSKLNPIQDGSIMAQKEHNYLGETA